MRFAGIDTQYNAACRMRDGTTLYADIYRPPGPGPHPVLLMRQPYGKALASTVTYAHPVWFAQQGFIVVIQDVRGRGASEGQFEPFVQEADDGYDTVEWAAALPGSNGKVGMYGFSYQGSTQWAAASVRPPHLAAIAPGMCAADLYHGMFYPHGRFAVGSFLPWAFQLARDTARREGDGEAEAICTQMMRQPDALLWQLPVTKEHPVLAKYFPTYYDWCSHPVYDDYWARRNWLDDACEAQIPALHIGGWFDNYLLGTLQSFEAVRAANRNPDAFHRLIVGPWVHIPWGRRAGGRDYGPQATGRLHEEHVRWFNYWLKGEGEPPNRHPAVRYFETGSNRWAAADDMALLGTSDGAARERWYVATAGHPANGASGGGRLSETPPGADDPAGADVFVYDARIPMPCGSYLPEDRSGLEDRYEILNFTGRPLGRSIHAAGAPRVTLRCQVAGGPSDVVAILTLVGADGSSRFLSIGRAEVPEEEAGEDGTLLQISMWPFAAELPEGASIRLELTGSAFPLFLRHPNRMPEERIPGAGPEHLHMATIAVLHDPAAPAFVELPVREPEYEPEYETNE